MRENFQITEEGTGKKYWISRHSAVCCVIICCNPEDETIKFLVEKRGKGCPDEVGKVTFPCGYLGYDETRRQAIIRELYEEIGLVVNEDDENLIEIETDDHPNHDPNQNIVTRYVYFAEPLLIEHQLRNGILNGNSKSRGGEADEVEEIILVDSEELDKYDWGFNHKVLAERFLENLMGDVVY